MSDDTKTLIEELRDERHRFAGYPHPDLNHLLLRAADALESATATPGHVTDEIVERATAKVCGSVIHVLFEGRSIIVELRIVRTAPTAALGTPVPEDETQWEYGFELVESDTKDVIDRKGGFESAAAAGANAIRAHVQRTMPDLSPLEIRICQYTNTGPWVPYRGEES